VDADVGAHQLTGRLILEAGDDSLTANSAPSDFVAHAGGMRRAATFRGVLPTYGRPVGGVLKRSIDVVGSLLLIGLLAPLFVCTMILVRLFVGGPVIFRHRRVGVGGTRFVCYKFRTMVTDGDKVLERYLAANPDAAGEWKRTRKLRDDPRVCSVAKVLRKSSLDELPQLFNVLRGDMSLVGPRPIVDDEIRHYGPCFEECFQARPGLSGLWQVSGRNGVSYERRVALDRYYARRWSIWVDMRILLKTVATVFSFHQTS
jgi:exopolysaccharide production protein ExoY